MSGYHTEIVIAASRRSLDPDLVTGLVEQESNYRFYAYRYEPAFFQRYLANNPKYQHRDPYEVSASFGLMQVMFPTAVEHGFDGEPWDLFNPAKNLEIGCTILAALFKWARLQYTGLASYEPISVTRSALASYNGGKGGNSPNTGTLRNQQYALAVLARYDRIKKAHTP